MLFIHSYKINYFCFFIFLTYNDVYFEYIKHYKIMTIKELKGFLFENYYREKKFCSTTKKLLKTQTLT